MIRNRIGCRLALLLFLAMPLPIPAGFLAAQLTRPQDPELTPLPARLEKIRERAEHVARLSAEEPEVAIATEISRLARGLTPSEFSQLDEHVIAQGLPSLAGAFADSVVAVHLSGTEWNSNKWTLPEAAILAPRFLDEAQATLAELAETPIMSDPLQAPIDWQQYEQVLWQVHVFRNRLDHAAKLMGLCHQNTGGINNKPAQLKQLNLSQQAALGTDYQALQVQLLAVERDLFEREVELRFYRLQDSVEILRSSLDKKLKLLAGFAMQHDYQVVADFYSETRPQDILRLNLREAGMMEMVQEVMTEGREFGQEQIRKGTLLMVGLHFWLRGRYGAGPEAHGLLKPESAMKNVDDMFALYMPRSFTTPSTPEATANRSPHYPRRHYFHWVVEHRHVQTQMSYTSNTTQSSEKYGSKLLGSKKYNESGFY